MQTLWGGGVHSNFNNKFRPKTIPTGLGNRANCAHVTDGAARTRLRDPVQTHQR